MPREPPAAPGSIGRLTGEVAPATAGYESVNRIGLLVQSHEATAGALGNAILMLARHASLRTTLAADPVLIPEFLCEVLRFDPPIQNTRRFAARDVRITSQWMPAGVAVLVVLAAANRDPCANPEPAQFLIRRKFRRLFTFGAGAHACPGQELTLAIAGPGLEFLLSEGLLPEALAPVRYRPSVNARVPLLAQEG